ncbi:mitochondrial 37S ribosomal protein RSM18 [Acrodontium crateriforme]|uniref:Small ribosomal subunit protein bS18m n=1 Tax=Acrodontium crateriforme TaxID=150365 RepID=A0AAQ3R911_9PEZI|nr:mitochondrial 37S ribosomal protein RSM18 [Acrodontium crateriforme]
MSLEYALKRLAIRPSTVCTQCRRMFASSANRSAQSATGAFAAVLQSNRDQDTAHRAPRTRGLAASTTRSAGNPSKGIELGRSMVQEIAAGQQAKRDAALADLQRSYTRQDLERQAVRKWKVGDVYSPSDLSGYEQAKWKRISRKPYPTRKTKGDVMDQLGMNPINEYKNFSIMSEYVSNMGRIQHRKETGLRPVNQRRMAKAIRRAIGVGLMPSTYRHPEIIKGTLETGRRF